MKICNQFFIKDIYRNKQYQATIKCAVCSEETNFSEPFPFELKNYTKWINNFVKIHKDKGCNKIKVKPDKWASGKISIAISI